MILYWWQSLNLWAVKIKMTLKLCKPLYSPFQMCIRDRAWGLRFLLGVMSGPVQASCLSAIGDHFGPNQRGAAVGIFMSCTSFGITTVNLYAPYVATHYGWQTAFLATAILPLLVLVLCYFTVRKPSAEILAQREAEASEAAAKLGVGQTSLVENLKHIISNRNIRCLAIAGFFATGTTWGVTQWANLYMVKQLGVTAIYAGQVMSVFGTAALIAKPDVYKRQDIDKKKIEIKEPLKTLGVHDVLVRVHPEITSTIKVNVVAE